MSEEFFQNYTIPLFASLSQDDLNLIVENLQKMVYEQGHMIIREGDEGDCLFLIKNGKVRVTVSLKETDEEIILSRLETGDYFGEMALITGEPRSASVVAEERTEVWKLFKSDFDALLVNYPDITLTLTHRLSERLSNSNKAREEAEKYYKDKFIPRGELSETSIISLLKFIEENTLSGHLELRHNDDTARFLFKKGQLADIDYNGLDETEAMDAILKWENGEFLIEPEILSISKTGHSMQAEDNVSDDQEAGETIDVQPTDALQKETEETEKPGKEFTVQELFKAYLAEKFVEFNRFSGLQITQNVLRQTYHKFKDYFDVIDDFRIDPAVEPVIHIDTQQWTEKHTLVAAILLRDLVNSIGREVVGIEFWTPGSKDQAVNAMLKDISFFEYFNQATDFIRL